jgi:hypothetical protein
MFEQQMSQSIEAGAPDITYSGNEGPKSPQQEQQMMEQQMMEQEQQMMAPVDYSSPAFRLQLIEKLMADEGLDYGAASAKADWIIAKNSRQGAAFGGIMGLDGRRKYGLGSKLKKTIRKIIPNELADIAVKAAPFVAPFNPIAAGLMSGIGGFDQHGSISKGLKSGLMNYGMGQLARGIGGGASNLQGASLRTMPGQTGFGSYFSSPIQNSGGLGKLLQGTADKTFATSGGSMDAYAGMGDPMSTGMDLVKKPGFVESIGNKISGLIPESTLGKIALGGGAVALGTALLGQGPEETVSAIMDRGEKLDIDGIRAEVTEAFKDSTGEKLLALRSKYPYLGTQASKNTAIMANGGRIGYGLGSLVSGSAGVFKPTSDSMSAGDAPSFEGGSGMGGMIADLIRKNPQMFSDSQNTSLSNQGFVNQGNQGFNGMFSKFFTNPKMYNQYLRNKEDFIDENLNEIDDREEVNMAYGGRIRRAEGGLMNLGGMEKDYRAEGGFVPIGAKEKADDVPARLSVNEFVFTADAVRSAGGGDIDKGAEVMERVMKNLEAGGQISEETQGMQGAREMFQTSQRLGEVI